MKKSREIRTKILKIMDGKCANEKLDEVIEHLRKLREDKQ